MKRKDTFRWLLLAAIIAAIVLLFVGCPLDEDDSVSISSRISMFMNDINGGNYGNLWRHMHPDSNAYETDRQAGVWEDRFPPEDRPITLGTLNISGSTATATITDANNNLYSGQDVIFTMKEDGKDVWKILSIGTPVNVD